MLKRLTRRLLVPAILTGMLSGLVPSMLAVRTAHADETSQPESSTVLDRTATPAPKRTEASEPAPLTADDVRVRSAVVPSDALASGTAGTCLFYITSDMRLALTPSDGQSGTLPAGSKASDWPWYRYAAYIRTVSFDKGVKTSSTLENAFRSSNTTDPEYSQLESVDLANLNMAGLANMHAAFANDPKLKTVSFKGVLHADGITTWTSAFYASGVESVDLTGVGDAAVLTNSMFSGCASLKTAVIPWTMAHVTDSSAMFYNCNSLSTLDTSAWRFGAVSNMAKMFSGCTGLTVLDSSGWNLSSATNMGGMFDGCASLSTLDSSGWHVAKVRSTEYMFNGCANLAALDVSGWDMSNAVLTDFMFYGCGSLALLDTSGWRLPNVTKAMAMFYNCSNLASLDVSGFGMDSASEIYRMFSGCRKLTSLDVSGWYVSRATNLSEMFNYCKGLTTLDVSRWDVGNVSSFGNMFNGCAGLESLDVSKWDMSKALYIDSMFAGCTGLSSLPVGAWNVGKVKSMLNTFAGCSGLTTLDVSKWDVSSCMQFASIFRNCTGLKTLDVSKWDVSKASRMGGMFSGCSGLTSLDVSRWDTGGATTMDVMFYNCKNLATLDVSGWDMSGVTDIHQMFDGCTGLTTLDVSRWDVDKVRNVNWLFSHCRGLKTIDVSKWTPHGLSRLYGVFSDCRSVGTLDLSGWDTTGVTSIQNLFQGCAGLTRIYVGDAWDMGQVTEDGHLFDGDVRLVGDDGKGLAYDASKNGKAYAKPDGGYLTLRADGTAYHIVTFRADGMTVATMRVRDGRTAMAPDLADTTWLADPDMNFNTDKWSGMFTAKGKRQTTRDGFPSGGAVVKKVPAGAVVRVDVDGDYTAATASGAVGWVYNPTGSTTSWSGYWCAAGKECSGSSYGTFASEGTIQPFTQICAWSDFGEAYIRHMQLTQVDPVTHNGIARDGYVFTGWDRDVAKPITGDTVFTARYRPVSYQVRFDGNKATSGTMTDQTLTYGTSQALTAATFQRDGYSLTGWNTRPDGTGKAFADRQTVANLLAHDGAVGTLYAQWAPTPPVITVVFHANDGTDETVKRVWASNNLDMKAIGLPDSWTRKGFAFHGWNLKRDGSGVEYKAGESLYGRMTTATVDLYADWVGLSSTLPQAGGLTKAPAYGAGLALMVLGAGAWLSAGRRRRMV